jgi:hypothetical protein
VKWSKTVSVCKLEKYLNLGAGKNGQKQITFITTPAEVNIFLP